MKIGEVSDSPVSRSPASHRQVSAAGTQQKIRPLVLVLGADADTGLLYKSFLEMWGYHVAEAVGTEEMFTITEYFQPDLILMDCSLKFESNLEIIQKIRGNMFLQYVPLVLLSGYSQAKIQALALKTGADEFFVKPLNFDDLKLSLQIYTGAPAQNKRQGENS